MAEDYEGATGDVLIEAVAGRAARACPALWSEATGRSPGAAIRPPRWPNAVTLEEVAKMALLTRDARARTAGPLVAVLREKHFARKHGPGAYYGQP